MKISLGLLLSIFLFYQNVLFAFDDIDPLIYGGELVKEDSPTYRSTVYWENNEGSCTGILISRNMVLTAAHCIDDEVNIGNVFFYKNKKKEVVVKISHVWKHEKYNATEEVEGDFLKTPGYDIAILKLAKDAPEGYYPAVIDWNRKPKFLEKFALAGFGIGSRGNLKKIEVSSVNYAELAKIIIFDQDKSYAICYGDSGGPAYYQNKMQSAPSVVAGIASEFFIYNGQSHIRTDIRKDCKTGGAVSYTSVVDYRDWIEDKL